MKVLYLLTIPPSPMTACDAVVQDVEALRANVGGEICHLYLGRSPGTRFPRRWWGLQRWLYLRRAEQRVDVHHVLNPDPFPFDVLRFLRRPIVYTVIAGTGGTDRAMAQRLARQIHTLVVPTASDLDRLRGWGIANASVIRPGIDVSRFSYTPLPTDAPPTLLMGSAPWTREQFGSKGVDALLEAAQRRHDLHLIFLWRGVLAEEMARRVEAAGLSDRVQILNEQVDVNNVLARVHASVALAADDALIKAYPHSLLESLAAGKPVLVSRRIPMAQDVEQAGCGVVVDDVRGDALLQALDTLLAGYERYQRAALGMGCDQFDRNAMLAAYDKIYRGILPGNE